jgi:hypothetical protein
MNAQARFWTYINGSPVRIKLNTGDALSHSACWNTDEGWSAEANTWSFDGDTVTLIWTTDGVDCDGRLRRFGKVVCHRRQLSAGYISEELPAGQAFPEWQSIEERQRDYSAEAMNY